MVFKLMPRKSSGKAVHSSVPKQAAPWPQELGGNISHHSNRLYCLSCLCTFVSTSVFTWGSGVFNH